MYVYMCVEVGVEWEVWTEKGGRAAGKGVPYKGEQGSWKKLSLFNKKKISN